MATSKNNSAATKEKAAPLKESPSAETPKPTGKEAVLAKEDIKNITIGFDKLAVKKKEVEALVQKAETVVSTFDKTDKESVEALSNVIRELRTTRTGIESAKTSGSAPFRDLIAKWNADNNSIIEMIKEAEKKAKPIKEELDAEEEKRKNEKKMEAQKLLMNRIDLLKDLGFKQEDGFYVLNDENGEPVAELQAVEISTMSDVNWDKIQKLAKDHNDTKAEKAKQDLIKKQEEEKKIADEKEKNRLEKEKLANERFEIRKERLDMMGFTFTDTHISHPSKITEKIDVIKAMEPESWNEYVTGLKQKIADAQEKEKRDRLLDLIRLNGFNIEGGMLAKISVKGPGEEAFNYNIPLEEVQTIEQWDEAYKSYSDKLNEWKVKQDSIVSAINAKLDKLAAEGMVFTNHLGSYNLKATTPGTADFQISKAAAIAKDDQQFDTLIENIRKFKADDIEAKKLYDKNERERIERENADQQSDAKNIAQFKKDIQAAKAKFVLKKPNAELQLSNKVNAFLDSL